ncbi:MAG: binding domain protein, excisionase family protein [Candidatus Falkowbacteria bacterium GW2011_GWC2_38_22]|uniref:Binding domain protein, excisionase family protein n=1 Tax=Candidatus Falkowbacteria bacterium GW2011_GWE1_38_31 TaxID=1618638 RepID=A0A0G0M802_9BACT|nr:MAG: binding domain protein, excisionase family protein [Candidatus Falkowbacteria bacterium GW2011_GWF2_38_1205]KKQ60899.1 MAG: binding domain protein, excisionase family protein [Candidatus Falkowbacteria bacterium GW2011_GWC2_38_22]KKQ63017.1 MAG: binding domain protein, excisionase family protein [Candidatus Falkowbacteria bacterium GW2011_GWF1_38_22]KKQ65039.1 MAG: binding domain protein, excisionase family protein [Candidatus Falkowbacteria bacterium GW2011_GWE2_38_254]KKQ69814.1 MAG: 
MFSKGDIYTIKEVSTMLKVNIRTVYRWIDSGDLRVAKFGRKTYRVFEADLKGFVKKFLK